MNIGIWVLGDQLSLTQTALDACKKRRNTRVILIESLKHIQARPYHRQKLVLLWSAMKHFQQELIAEGWKCDYIESSSGFQDVLNSWIDDHQIEKLLVMQPNDRPFLEQLNKMDIVCTLKILNNNQFFWSIESFKRWSEDRRRLLLESFYREGRKKFNILLEDGEPAGGKWNYDKENREPPSKQLEPSNPIHFEPDLITRRIIDKVENIDIPLFGRTTPFRWGVTRENGRKALRYFLENRLQYFGPFEDAMLMDYPMMWHSLLSPYLNIGLIHPVEVVKAAEEIYNTGKAHITSVEGFVRQILGWREFIRGVYHTVDADYFERNFFAHLSDLPDFFWTGQTDMNCMRTVLRNIENTGYAHHIQRLMILSNFSTLAKLNPQLVEDWFHSVFIDSFDWVMQPNVLGMGLFADGGVFSTKPYIASANYIRKMSDYCDHCQYNSRIKTGSDACPFNFLYWSFLIENQEKLESIGRMGLVLSHLRRIEEEEKKSIRKCAVDWCKTKHMH